MLGSPACWNKQVSAYQTGVYYRRVEVGQLVTREPSLVVAHVTQISVSPVFLSVSSLGSISLLTTTQPFERRYWKLFLLLKIQLYPAFPVVICRCSLVVRMQQLLLKVLCSTLLLLTVVPSMYSQSGRAASFYYHMTVSEYFNLTLITLCSLCLLSLIPSLLSM